MVGLIDPNPNHPSKQPERRPQQQQQQQQQEKWWKGVLTNPVQVKRPAQGKYSPRTDERCITWCSQTVRGRTEGQDPWCRSICIRRVFEHEVRQLTSHFSHDAAHHSRLVASSSAAAAASSSQQAREREKERERDGKGVALKYPLPPEGQRRLFRSPDDEDDSNASGSDTRYIYNSSSSSTNTTSTSTNNTHRSKSTEKYWEEGWYVWMTKNRWAAQEKMDLMMLDLEKQTNWNRVKEMEERAWVENQAQMAEKEREREREGREGVPDGLDPEAHFAPARHPYPNAAEESFLIRLPTRLDLTHYTQATLSPTLKLLHLVHHSFQNGDQKDLALRAWEATRDGVPFKLVRNVFKICLESLRRGPKDGDGGEGEDE